MIAACRASETLRMHRDRRLTGRGGVQAGDRQKTQTTLRGVGARDREQQTERSKISRCSPPRLPPFVSLTSAGTPTTVGSNPAHAVWSGHTAATAAGAEAPADLGGVRSPNESTSVLGADAMRPFSSTYSVEPLIVASGRRGWEAAYIEGRGTREGSGVALSYIQGEIFEYRSELYSSVSK